MHISGGVTFRANTATTRNGALIGLHSCDHSTISEAYFEGNGKTDISVSNSHLSISNSNFTQGTGSHVMAYRSQVAFQGVRVYSSSGAEAEGLGL